jgi:5-methylcytosine-specific restriction endonuclease McrBC regulatory subunit McrC
MHKCKRSLSNALKLLEGISDVRITPEQAMSFRPERKELRFRPLIEMAARFIYNNGKHQDIKSDVSGGGTPGLGSMWSAWTLFESYVFRELSGINTASKYKLGEQWEIRNQVIGKNMIRTGKEAAPHFSYALKPDIIISNKKTGAIEYICDTKWKYQRREAGDNDGKDANKINVRQKEFVVKKSDLYQMFAYSRFYSNKSGQHPKIALIYPSANPKPEQAIERGVNNYADPLSALKLIETIYFNLPEGGNNKTQTAVEIYEFPVPLAKASG